MSKKTFTKEQANELLKNPNVLRCSEKSITYHKDFKVAAVKKYEEGLPPSVIFAEAGFSLSLIGQDRIESRLKSWRKAFKGKGAKGFAKETRGGPGRTRPSTRSMTDQEKLKYYEVQVAYLKAENAFLAKLRKQR